MGLALSTMGNGLCVVLFLLCCGADSEWHWAHLIRPIW